MSTGRLDRARDRGDPLLTTAQQLSDAVLDWWDGRPPPLVYRTRSTPAARSSAFTRTVEWQTLRSRPLWDAVGLLVALVTRHGFVVPDYWPR